jgi:hypothetical protein
VVHVGTTGHKNLEAHRESKACHKRAQGARSNRPEKANQVIDAFFKPRVPLNPSTVSAPPPIRPGEPFALAPERREGLLAGPGSSPVRPMADSSGELSVQATILQGRSPASQLPTQLVLDKKAVSLLEELEAAAKQIPSDTPSATPEHQLNIFAVDPRTCVAEPGEDDWLILNQMMKSLRRDRGNPWVFFLVTAPAPVKTVPIQIGVRVHRVKLRVHTFNRGFRDKTGVSETKPGFQR